MTVVKELIYVDFLKQSLEDVQKGLMMKDNKGRSGLDLKKFHLDAKVGKELKNMIVSNSIRKEGWKWAGIDDINPVFGAVIIKK